MDRVEHYFHGQSGALFSWSDGALFPWTDGALSSVTEIEQYFYGYNFFLSDTPFWHKNTKQLSLKRRLNAHIDVELKQAYHDDMIIILYDYYFMYIRLFTH